MHANENKPNKSKTMKHYVITGNDTFLNVESNLLFAVNFLLNLHRFGWADKLKSYSQYRRDFLKEGEVRIYHNSGVMYRIKLFVKPKK